MSYPSQFDIEKAIQNVESGNFTQIDVQILKLAYRANQISVVASGPGSVSAGGSITGATIITGNGNQIVIQEPVLKQITKPFYKEVINVLSSWLILSSICSAILVFSTPKSIDFFIALFGMFPAFTILGCAGIMYERTFKNKYNFDHSFGYWSMYPIIIAFEMELKFIIFILKSTPFIKW